MTEFPVAVGILLALAVGISLIASTALAALTDALDRLHMSSLVVSLSAGLIAAAVWIDNSDWQVRSKAALVAVLLFAMNSILTHATARALRIRGSGHWGPQPDEQMPIVSAGAGEKAPTAARETR